MDMKIRQDESQCTHTGILWPNNSGTLPQDDRPRPGSLPALQGRTPYWMGCGPFGDSTPKRDHLEDSLVSFHVGKIGPELGVRSSIRGVDRQRGGKVLPRGPSGCSRPFFEGSPRLEVFGSRAFPGEPIAPGPRQRLPGRSPGSSAGAG
jgi:hypothetical protein